MKTAEAKDIINEKIDKVILLAESISKSYDLPSLVSFKSELKFIRSFIDFVRLQRNDRTMRFPDKCRYIYHIAGSLIELLQDTQPSPPVWREKMDKTQAEWKRHYDAVHLQRLKKQINEYDYAHIHPELLNNFFSRDPEKTI